MTDGPLIRSDVREGDEELVSFPSYGLELQDIEAIEVLLELGLGPDDQCS